MAALAAAVRMVSHDAGEVLAQASIAFQ
jgi:hypothetical protein